MLKIRLIYLLLFFFSSHEWLFEPVDTIGTDASRRLSQNRSLTCTNQVFLPDDFLTYFGCCHFTTCPPIGPIQAWSKSKYQSQRKHWKFDCGFLPWPRVQPLTFGTRFEIVDFQVIKGVSYCIG